MEENKEQKQEDQDLQDNYLYTSYLIGSMEKTAQKDDGSSKREIFEAELLMRNVYPINPCRLEKQKTGLITDDLKEKMKGWVEGGKWELFNAKATEIWCGVDIVEEEGLVHIPGDIDYVRMSDWITCIYNKGDSPVGTWFEVGIAMYFKIPVYLITDVNKTELSKSLLQGIGVTKGEVFYTPNQYFEFLDKKYKLKRVEPKEEK